MTYRERSITIEEMAKFLQSLDSDEGIRIDGDSYHIFVNKASKRYCIDVSMQGRDEFVYKNSVSEVMDFLKDYATQTAKIVAY